MSRRGKLIALVAGIPALLVLAALIAVYVMLQPQRFTATIRQAANNAGLQLSLAAPAQPSLWPRPGVVLQGMTLTPQNSQTPVLQATRVRLVVPWHTVLGGKTTISALELDAPRLDVNGLRTLLAQHMSGTAPTATLPGIDAGITVHDGSLVQDDTLLANHIELQTGALHPGTPFKLNVSAHIAQGADYSLALRTTPQKAARRVTFAALQLTLSSDAGARMQLQGAASWSGGARFRTTLDGHLKPASGQTYTLAVTSTPATRTQSMRVHLEARGKGLNADLRLPPVALLTWWKQVTGAYQANHNALAPPPLTGTVHADHLQAGSVSISGLEVQSGPDVPATSSSSANTPNQTTTNKP